MRFPWNSRTAKASGSVDFDQLRARLEGEVPRPAVIAITSSTPQDGKEIAARGLASSLAVAGYATLLLDTSLTSRLVKPAPGLTLEDIASLVIPDPGAGAPIRLTLNDQSLQKTTSQREIDATLGVLRTKFDYIIVNVEHAVSTSFATSLLGAASAVLVTVRTGRRRNSSDAALSATLDRIGSRFLGVLALDRSIIKDDPSLVTVPDSNFGSRRIRAAQAEKEEAPRREVAEWSA